MLVGEARRWGAEMLSPLESPRLEADLLLMHVLGWQRHRLLVEVDSPLSRGELEEYRRALAARRSRTPLQHITGRVEFMSVELLAGPEAMVPRPETEVMVEALLELLPPGARRLLDVGTGSGAVAVALAVRLPRCRVWATDIHRPALGLARRNLVLHDLHNVDLVACDLASALAGGFHGVAANLPYVPTGEIASLQPEVRFGDPRAALDGGPDGLDLTRRLAGDLPRLLAAGGAAVLEVADDQTPATAQLLEASGLADVEVRRDLAGRRRVVCGRKGG
ncbi:MAG: peptide chain release factor N(5)-glutamine methyltransferase [Candidatus Fermentibacteraceae bacterium]